MIDLHCDTIMKLIDYPSNGDLYRNTWKIDIEKLQKAHSKIQDVALFINMGETNDPYGRYEEMRNLCVSQIHNYGEHIQHVLSYQDVEVKPAIPENTNFKLKAVVVDDDASLRQLIADILEQHQVTTYTFEDAKAALSALEDLSYDLIITDIQLPKMNGFHFMETVKRLPFYEQQPIIAMTGRMDINTEDYIESGFSKVVYKPFEAHIWFDILSELFPESITKPEEDIKKASYRSEYFDTHSIAGFLNYDEEALKSLLEIFLKDTKKHIAELKSAQKQNDIKTINDLSHRMLTMFKQLNAKSVVPHLEVLEHATVVDSELLEALELELKAFYEDMQAYITPNYTP